MTTDLIRKAKDIKIIFFDIDDTLRVKKTGYLPASIKEVFKKLKAIGIKTGIATGRSYFGVVDEIKELDPDYFVTVNGAHVQDKNHEEIYKNPLPKDLIEDIITWSDTEKIGYTFVAKDNVVVNEWNDLTEESLVPIYGKLDTDEKYYQKDDIYQMLTMTKRDVDDTLPEHLKDKIRLVRWHEYSSDVVLAEGNKAEGVSKVLEKLNLEPSNLLVFGDELNDREIFDLAQIAVAMEVSHPEIKEKADLITDKVEEDGIKNALEKLEII